ncbi:MAG: metal-dependent transcriptional regulator, partial [Thermoleophilia bacterium]|nr:metal-dependent transcriptional regulator [Thermoleophilia bacterium]
LALEVVRHHRLLESFLARALGMSWDRIHAEAEVLEHHISEELEDLIDAHLGFPEFDPHGHPIPRRDGTVPDRAVTPLTIATIGSTLTVEQVRDDSPDVLRYLATHQLDIGAHITLLTLEPIAGIVTVQAGSGDIVVLGMDLASRIDIREDHQS